MTICEKLEEIEKNCRHKDWNNYNADPIPQSVIDNARAMIPLFNVNVSAFPTGRRSIQFEIHEENGTYTECELFEGGSIKLFVCKDYKALQRFTERGGLHD